MWCTLWAHIPTKYIDFINVQIFISIEQPCMLKKEQTGLYLNHRSCARFDQLCLHHNIYLVGQTGQDDVKPGMLLFY